MQLVSRCTYKAYKVRGEACIYAIGILHVSGMQNIEGSIIYKNVFFCTR